MAIKRLFGRLRRNAPNADVASKFSEFSAKIPIGSRLPHLHVRILQSELSRRAKSGVPKQNQDTAELALREAPCEGCQDCTLISDAQWPWENLGTLFLLVEFKGEPFSKKSGKGAPLGNKVILSVAHIKKNLAALLNLSGAFFWHVVSLCSRRLKHVSHGSNVRFPKEHGTI